MTKVEEFNNIVLGEKLLYTNTDFTREEAELVVKAVYNRMSYNLYYGCMIYDQIPRLLVRVLPKIEENELTSEKELITKCAKSANRISSEEMYDAMGYGLFCTGVNYGVDCPSDYLKMINENAIDARVVEGVLSATWDNTGFNLDHKFLITANMLFIRNKEFYNKEYVENLTRLIYQTSKRDFETKEEYKKYKKAAKASLKHIKEFNKMIGAENKTLKKVKK